MTRRFWFNYTLATLGVFAFVIGTGKYLQAQDRLYQSAPLTLSSHNVTEMTISADKTMITIHRALDVNTVLCIERQPERTMYTWGGNGGYGLVVTPAAEPVPAKTITTEPPQQSGTITLGGTSYTPPPTTPKVDIPARVCMTVEKWLAAGGK